MESQTIQNAVKTSWEICSLIVNYDGDFYCHAFNVVWTEFGMLHFSNDKQWNEREKKNKWKPNAPTNGARMKTKNVSQLSKFWHSRNICHFIAFAFLLIRIIRKHRLIYDNLKYVLLIRFVWACVHQAHFDSRQANWILSVLWWFK